MEVKWPTYAVDNAAAILKDSKKRMEEVMDEPTTDDIRRKIVNGQILALDLGISVIEAIPQHTMPQLPSIKLIFRNATGELVKGLATTLHNTADILDEANNWGWKHDPYDD